MKKRLLFALLLFLVCLTLSEIIPYYISHKSSAINNYKGTELKIKAKLAEANNIANNALDRCEKLKINILYKTFADSLSNILNQKKISLYLFNRNNLLYWSKSNDIFNITKDSSKIHFYKIQNAWYLGQWVIRDTLSSLVLLHFKNEFSYQNKFLKNTYNKDFKELTGYNITEGNSVSNLSINVDSKTNIYLTKAKNSQSIYSSTIKSILQWASFFVFIWIIYLILSSRVFKERGFLRISLFSVLLIILRIISLFVGFPNKGSGVFFGPEIYANTIFIPSLGDFLINALLFFFIVIIIYRSFNERKFILDTKTKYLLSFVSIAFIWGIFFIVDGLFSSLVLHSTINLETFRIFNLSYYTIIAYLAISLWIVSSILLCDLWFKLVGINLKLIWQFAFSSLSFILIITILVPYKAHPSAFGIIFSILSFLFIAYNRNYKLKFDSNWFLLFTVTLALYSVFHTTDLSFEKDIEVRKVLAINLSNERDPVAETLFQSLEKKIKGDTIIHKYIEDIQKHDVDMYRHLQEKYFNSYFKKYDLKATVCYPGSEIVVYKPDEQVDCKSFYDGIIYNLGIMIPSSSFYFLNNQTGRINYLGVIEFKSIPRPATLYIELESKLSRDVLGYPELLLDSRFSTKELISMYSTAKYQKNQLIAQTGSFPYRLQNSLPLDTIQKFNFVNQSGYNHLVYLNDADNLVVLSKPRENLLNTTVSFTYVFSFYVIFIFILLKIGGFSIILRSVQGSFRNRIKLAMILVIFLSLILVAAITIYYSIRNFEEKSRANLNEKTLSIIAEVERDITVESIHSKSFIEYLNNRLIRLSNIFYSDINIYDNNGDLVATSRPEIFERELLGKKMNPTAWYEMNYLHNPRLIHKEKIGDLTYLSAYVPLVENGNKIIAYLNLPHFTRQNELIRDLYSIIVAIVNIYAFLTLIAIAIAILISNQISKPLEMIMANLGKVDITRHIEPIKYDRNDELGQLVREYNQMVFELAESADKLARSQRESAWREMAKQIAHEIKNPLTPIKLNLQHLIKSKREGVADWDARFEKFSSTLFDQITALSAIATEFSDFAKMPISSVSEVNLNAVLDEVVSLFAGYSNIKVSFKNNAGKLLVNADKEQLFRVFVNLMKNAIQSIDVKRRGEISICMSMVNEDCLISIKDNGKGIPEELRSKMFSPNFTTKSGGMGLGLAIVKGIIESINGKVWFETETNVGTTFYVEIPTTKQN